jgi:hypothetical protein
VQSEQQSCRTGILKLPGVFYHVENLNAKQEKVICIRFLWLVKLKKMETKLVYQFLLLSLTLMVRQRGLEPTIAHDLQVICKT